MIKITNLKKFYGKKTILDTLDFNLKNGEIKALIGTNGAGKSTMVDIICGVKKCDSGSFIIDGLDGSLRTNKVVLNNIIGYMPQSFCLFNDLTVYENLEYVCSIYNLSLDGINRVLEECQLSEYRNTIASKLSGGYRQLLSLATVLIHNPKIFVLDEPTSAMDPIFRRKFWKIIKSYNNKGVTILLITHYLEELLECDSFALLSKGKIQYDAKVKDFKKNGFVNIEEILNKYSVESTNE